MVKTKIDKALDYYNFKSRQIRDFVNSSKDLTVEQIIEFGEELAVLEYKITALEVANESQSLKANMTRLRFVISTFWRNLITVNIEVYYFI